MTRAMILFVLGLGCAGCAAGRVTVKGSHQLDLQSHEGVRFMPSPQSGPLGGRLASRLAKRAHPDRDPSATGAPPTAVLVATKQSREDSTESRQADSGRSVGGRETRKIEYRRKARLVIEANVSVPPEAPLRASCRTFVLGHPVRSTTRMKPPKIPESMILQAEAECLDLLADALVARIDL